MNKINAGVDDMSAVQLSGQSSANGSGKSTPAINIGGQPRVMG
jgi:Fe-S cluster assembly ATPase SufC